jgi:hypothetical protein
LDLMCVTIISQFKILTVQSRLPLSVVVEEGMQQLHHLMACLTKLRRWVSEGPLLDMAGRCRHFPHPSGRRGGARKPLALLTGVGLCLVLLTHYQREMAAIQTRRHELRDPRESGLRHGNLDDGRGARPIALAKKSG